MQHRAMATSETISPIARLVVLLAVVGLGLEEVLVVATVVVVLLLLLLEELVVVVVVVVLVKVTSSAISSASMSSKSSAVWVAAALAVCCLPSFLFFGILSRVVAPWNHVGHDKLNMTEEWGDASMSIYKYARKECCEKG
jgi:hypothetical protein